MQIKIALCDDEKTALAHLERDVRVWAEAAGHTLSLRTFPSAEAFLFAYEDDCTYDLLLLDVEMKELSGIDLAKRLRRAGSRAEIVFITSHFEFSGEGYEVDALHYLIKPVAQEKLAEVLSRAAERLAVQPASLVIQCEGETVKLYERDILYAESFLHDISIYTKGRDYRIKESISAFEARLGDGFYRTHRSYLVSLSHVTRISRGSVTVAGREIPLARGKYDAINRAFIAYN